MNEHQFPVRDQVFLDHVGIFVSEFVQSGAALQRLGFTVSDFHAHRSALTPGEPLKPLGTGNRCVMLRTGFLELLGPTGEQTPIAAALHAALARYDGLHLIAFSAADPERFHAGLSERGLKPVPIARIRRNHPMQDGSLAEVGGSVVRLAPEAWPEGRVQTVFPEMAPEVMWQPHLLGHANGAIGLTEMLIAVAEPEARAEQFACFTGKPLRRDGSVHVIELDRGRLYITGHDAAQRALPGAVIAELPYMAAVAVEVETLADTGRFMTEAGIPHTSACATLQPAQRAALGASIVFHDRTEARPFAALCG